MIVRAACVIALMSIACTACAAELGRMFYTPAQRATLDTARKQNIRTEIGTDDSEPQQKPVAAPLPQNISVNGIIRRSDGKNTIWLNERPIDERQTGGVKAAIGKNDNRVRLSVPESGRSVDIKVGQTVEMVSGAVDESYLRRPAAKPEAKTGPAAENTGADVSKVTPAPPRETLRSDPVAQKRPARAAERDAPDDAGRNSSSGQK